MNTITKTDLENALRATKTDLESALIATKTELESALIVTRTDIMEALRLQDERFAERLMRHFYTKDETDRKFATKEELKQTEKRLVKTIDNGIHRVEILFEDSKSKFELLAENLIHTNKRVDGLDSRVVKL